MALLKREADRTNPETQAAASSAPLVWVAPGVGVIFDQSLRHGVQHRFSLRFSSAWLETRQHTDVGAGHRVRRPARVFCRHPELRVAIREFEMGRHHADDREEASAQFDGPANHTWVAMEKRFPPRITQDDH